MVQQKIRNKYRSCCFFINEELKLKYDSKDLWNYNASRKKYKDPLHQYSHAKMSAKKL